MTCWRRLGDWQVAGVWGMLHVATPRRLWEHGQIDWGRASIDGASVLNPLKGGPGNRLEPGRPGQAIQQAAPHRRCAMYPVGDYVTGANRHDSMAFESTSDAIPPVPGLEGRPRKRPDKLYADKGYDCRRCQNDCADAASRLESPAKASRAKTALGDIDGWSSAPMRGLPDSASCDSASSGGLIFILRYSSLPPPSFASALWMTCVSGS